MKFGLIISCFVLVTLNLAEAFVPSSLEEGNLEFVNDTQLIDESIEINLKSRSGTVNACFLNQRGRVRGLGNRCLGVRNSSNANQTPITMQNCNSNANQRFLTLSNDNTIRVLGRCLESGTGSIDGSFVRIHPCHGGLHQQWILTPSGQIVNCELWS